MADLEFVDQHNMVACLERTDGNAEFHQIVDFLTTSLIHYALTISPTIYASYIEQFWATAKSKTINDVKQIHATVDGKTVVISKSSVRSDLHCNDEDVEGEVSGQPSEPQPPSSIAPPSHEEQVTTVVSQPQKTHTPRQTKRGRDTKIPQSSSPPKKVGDEAVCTGEDNRVVRAATTVTCLEGEQESGKINKSRSMTTLNEPSPQETSSDSGPSMEHQDDLTDFVPPTPYDSPLSTGHTPRSDEGDIDDEFDDINDMVDEAIKNVEGDTVNAGGAVNTATTDASVTTAGVSITATTRVSAASASVTTAGVSISTAEPRTPPITITTVFEDKDLTIA
nr:xylulose kinase-1 [Tanacetum cinerariifolium]